ncbi:MAG: multiheme c-type cytochrome [Candidatus Methanoperedens sp.]|nr:multiheme c-type cytochrome [Candidatus Methanoperedens sp.]
MSSKVIYGAIIGFIAIWIIPVVQANEEFQSSYTCIECHPDRYEEWTHSTHALAVSDPVFEASYMRALKSDPQYREYCLSCHSPITRASKDFNLTKSISIEGVGCSFCHSVTGVEKNNYIFNQSNPMQGPYSDSKTEAHTSAYSDLLTKSEFCAGCHEFSINDVPVYETYSEWKESPYASEGKQCQDCHMEAKRGEAAKNGTIREKVYQHFWYGGHSGLFLDKAFDLKEDLIQENGDMIKVTLNITNKNVGHKVPSGFPARKVILHFTASDENGQEIYNENRVYAKTLVDQYGNEVADFWKATSISKDNRIKPRESRIEVFEFKVPDSSGKVKTKATLEYQLEAEIITKSLESMNLEIAETSKTTSLNRTIGVEATIAKNTPGIGWIGAIAVMIAVSMIYRKKN